MSELSQSDYRGAFAPISPVERPAMLCLVTELDEAPVLDTLLPSLLDRPDTPLGGGGRDPAVVGWASEVRPTSKAPTGPPRPCPLSPPRDSDLVASPGIS